MLRHSKAVKIIIAIIVLAAGGYAVSRIHFSGTIPADFKEARLQGALISQNIVDLSNQLTSDLDKVNQLDQNKNYTDALNLTTDIVKRSQDIRNQAIDLSAQLEKMTRSLSEINSLSARQAAMEAINNRLALISRLIDYSGYLGQLLDNLRSRFLGLSPHNNEAVTLIDQINSEVKSINGFNEEASAAMAQFDKLVNQ